MSTTAALARARERVRRFAVIQWSAWEKGEGERGPGSMALPARSGRVGHGAFPAGQGFTSTKARLG